MADITVSFSKYPYDPSRKDYVHFTTKTGSFESLGKYLVKEVWSPVVWSPGYRKKLNFKETHLIGLDFDDGALSLEDAVTYVKEIEVSCIIGVTKSHLLEKVSSSGEVKPPCDRFRIIIAAEKCTSLLDYEYTNKIFMDNLPCDQSCKDGARYFAPCREIVYECYSGSLAGWIEAPPKPPFAPKDYAKGQMPLWITDLINHGTDLGGRHKSCYKIGAQLSRYGYGETEIVHMIMKGPMKDIGLSDVERAVRNGMSAAQGGEW